MLFRRSPSRLTVKPLLPEVGITRFVFGRPLTSDHRFQYSPSTQFVAPCVALARHQLCSQSRIECPLALKRPLEHHHKLGNLTGKHHEKSPNENMSMDVVGAGRRDGLPESERLLDIR